MGKHYVNLNLQYLFHNLKDINLLFTYLPDIYLLLTSFFFSFFFFFYMDVNFLIFPVLVAKFIVKYEPFEITCE